MRVNDQALIDQRLQIIEIGTADRLDGIEIGAAAKRGEPSEQRSFGRRQQVVAPGDRRA